LLFLRTHSCIDQERFCIVHKSLETSELVHRLIRGRHTAVGAFIQITLKFLLA